MARGTIRGYDEPLPQQPLSVDALREILEDMILMDRPLFLHGGSFLVTSPAKVGHLQDGDCRTWIFGRKNIMGAMAILALRREWIASGDGFPMERFRMQLLLGFMTRRTTDARKILIVREFFSLQIRMAGNARERAVDRSPEFLLIEEHRNRFTPASAGQSFITVAREAITVLLGTGGQRSKQEEAHDEEDATAGASIPPGKFLESCGVCTHL